MVPNEFLELEFKSLVGDSGIVRESIQHRLLYSRQSTSKLICESREKFGRITAIVMPPRKKEAKRKPVLPVLSFIIALCDRMSDRRLPGSGGTNEPAHRTSIAVLSPLHYISQHRLPSILLAYRCFLVLALNGMVCGILIGVTFQRVEQRC